jgi:hypothetical protein
VVSTAIVIVGVAAPTASVAVVILLATIWLGVVTRGTLVVSTRAANLLDMLGHRRLILLRHQNGSTCVHVHVHVRIACEVGCTSELLLSGIIWRLLLHTHPHHRVLLLLLEHGLSIRVIHIWHLWHLRHLLLLRLLLLNLLQLIFAIFLLLIL